MIAVSFPTHDGPVCGPVTIYDAAGTVLRVLTVPEFRARYGHVINVAGTLSVTRTRVRPAYRTCSTCGGSTGWTGLCRRCHPIAHLGGQAFKRARERARVTT